MEVEVCTKNLLFTRKLIRVEILIEAKYQQVPDYGYSNTHKEIMLRLLRGYIYIFRIYQIILVCLTHSIKEKRTIKRGSKSTPVVK
jgi:hypothetical protein